MEGNSHNNDSHCVGADPLPVQHELRITEESANRVSYKAS
jgi:hypothetical protein